MENLREIDTQKSKAEKKMEGLRKVRRKVEGTASYEGGREKEQQTRVWIEK